MKISAAYKLKEKLINIGIDFMKTKIRTNTFDRRIGFNSVKSIIEEENCFFVEISSKMVIDVDMNLRTIFGSIGLNDLNADYQLAENYTEYITNRVSSQDNFIREYEINMYHLEMAKKVLELELGGKK